MKQQLLTFNDYFRLIQDSTIEELKIIFDDRFETNIGLVALEHTLNANKLAMLKWYNEFLSQKPELKHFLHLGSEGEILEKPNMATMQEHVSEKHKAWIKAGEDIIFNDVEIDRHHAGTSLISVKDVDIAILTSHKGWRFFPRFKTLEDILIAING